MPMDEAPSGIGIQDHGMEKPRGCDLTAFPSSLFPTHYRTGPTTATHRFTPGTSLLGPVQRLDSWENDVCPTTGPLDEVQKPKWVSQKRHEVEWEPMEPVALPFLPPNEVCAIPDLTFKDEQSEGIVGQGKNEAYHAKSFCFVQQMSNFFMDHHRDAFLSMGKLLEPCFTFRKAKPKEGEQVTAGHMLSDRKFSQKRLKFAELLGDALWEVPHDVLAGCLREELRERRAQERFDAARTGGCLHYLPPLGARKHGLLVYPSGSSMDVLSFQTIVQKCEGKACRSSCIKTQKASVKFHLTGGIRQISTSSVRQEVFVGVRSDYSCGLWTTAGESALQPKCVEVVQLKEPATCLTVSPHIPGELLVASESGAVYLWVAQKSLQCVRRESENLHFNAESRWRWCHFTAHPRVISFTDRTGVDATDARIGQAGNTSLFRIGKAAGCRKGERVVLSQHLHPVNPFHFLVATQYSAYLMDERLPILPVLRWSHGLSGPPTFAHATRGPGGGGGGAGGRRRRHLLLGTQRTHELLLLSYTGGEVEPCCTTSLPRKLACASEWLDHVQPLMPRQKHLLQHRLESAGAGVTAIAHDGGCGRLTVLQLSTAGDVFYQTLRQPSASGAASGGARVAEPPAATRSDRATLDEPVAPAALPPERGTPAAPLSSGGAETLCSDGLGTGSAGAEAGVDGVQGVGGDATSDVSAGLVRAETKLCKRWTSAFLRQWRAACKPPPPPSSQKQARRFRRQFRRLQCRVPQKPPDVDGVIVNQVRATLRAEATAITAGGHGAGEEKSGEVRAQPPLQLLHPVLPPPQGEEPVPFPEPVADGEAKDDLSSRLTAAWQGEWHEWWEEKMGVGSKKRAQEARRRRRMEKSRVRHHRRLKGNYAASTSGWMADVSDTLSCSGMSVTSKSNYLGSDHGSAVTSGTFFSQSPEPSGVELDDDILRGHLSDRTQVSNVTRDFDFSQDSLFEDDTHTGASNARCLSLVSSSQNLPSSILKKKPSKVARPSLTADAAVAQDSGELWTDMFGESVSQASQSSTPFLSRSKRPVQPSGPQGPSQKPSSSLGPPQREPFSPKRPGPAAGDVCAPRWQAESSSRADASSPEVKNAAAGPRRRASGRAPQLHGSSSQPVGSSPIPQGAAFYSQGSFAAGEGPSASLPQMSSSQPAASLTKKKKRFTMGF